MMDDKELADAVVALEVGYRLGERFDGLTHGFQGDLLEASAFVRDWRVAGALMEKCPHGFQYWLQQYDDSEDVWIVEPVIDGIDGRDKSLARAIIEACVEVFSADPGRDSQKS